MMVMPGAWHYHPQVKRRMFRLLEDKASNPVMAAALEPIVVVAMHSMIAGSVALLDA